MKIAKLELAATTGMRDRDMDLDYFGGLDSIMTAGINALSRSRRKAVPGRRHTCSLLLANSVAGSAR